MAVAMLAEVLARGFVDDAAVGGEIPAHIDCQAVIDVLGQPWKWASEKFAFAGWWTGLLSSDTRRR